MQLKDEMNSPLMRRREFLAAAAGLAAPHMPATGVSGLDLYARDEDGRLPARSGGDRWLAVARPTSQQVETPLIGNVDPLPGGRARRYTLYLPLYNGTEALEVG